VPDEQKAPSTTDEKGGDASTQEKTVPMKSYTKLQADLQKAKEDLKTYQERDREGQSVEAQLSQARQDLADATRELKSVKLKSVAPEDLHDWIDTQFAKGRDLDEDDIQVLVERMTDTTNKSEKAEKVDKKAEPKEKSGIRNGQPKIPDSDAEADELLKNTPMSAFFGSGRR
jgi:hypothetical protein